MNTITTRAVTTVQHPPSPASIPSRSGVDRRRVRLIDRVALRVGVALVAWSRRPRLLDGRTEVAHRVRLEQSRAERESRWHRQARLLLPPR